MIALYIILGIIVLLIAIRPLLQVKMSSPKISVKFSVGEQTNATAVLQCEIYNTPITNKFLNLYRIKRKTATDIVASFFINEFGSNRIVSPGMVPEIIPYSGSRSQRITLPASTVPVVFGVLLVDRDKGQVKPFGRSRVTAIESGRYSVLITITVDGKNYDITKNFSVITEYPYANWSVN